MADDRVYGPWCAIATGVDTTSDFWLVECEAWVK